MLTQEILLPFLLKVIASAAGLAGLASAMRETFLKFRGRSDLAKAVRLHQDDVAKVSDLLTRNKLDDAADVLRKYVAGLPEGERANVESALSQRSQVGRADYIRGVSHANRADLGS